MAKMIMPGDVMTTTGRHKGQLRVTAISLQNKRTASLKKAESGTKMLNKNDVD